MDINKLTNEQIRQQTFEETKDGAEVCKVLTEYYKKYGEKQFINKLASSYCSIRGDISLVNGFNGLLHLIEREVKKYK